VRNCVQLVLRDFEKFWLLGNAQKRILTNFKNLVKFMNFNEFQNGKSRILSLCVKCLMFAKAYLSSRVASENFYSV